MCLADVLVVVDCCRRFEGGGETSLPLELGLLLKPGRVDMLGAVLLARVVHDGSESS